MAYSFHVARDACPPQNNLYSYRCSSAAGVFRIDTRKKIAFENAEEEVVAKAGLYQAGCRPPAPKIRDFFNFRASTAGLRLGGNLITLRHSGSLCPSRAREVGCVAIPN